MFNKVTARGNPRSGIINHLDLQLTLNYLENGSKSVQSGSQSRPNFVWPAFLFASVRARGNHSDRKLFTGLAMAAFIAWKLMVTTVTITAAIAAAINTQGPILIR